MSTIPPRATSSRRAFVAGGLAASMLGIGAAPVGAQRPPSSRPAPISTAAASIRDLLGHYPARWGTLAQMGSDALEVVNVAAALAPHGITPTADAGAGTGAEEAASYPATFTRGTASAWAFQDMWVDPAAWQESFGINPFAVQAIAAHGLGEDSCTILRVAFDRDQVHAAWSALGYAPVPGTDGIMRLDMDSNARMDFVFMGIHGVLYGAYDVAAIVADDVIAFGSHQEHVERARSLTPGAAGSLLVHLAIAACADILPDTTALLRLLNGGLFWADPTAEPLLPQVAGINTTEERLDQLAERLEAERALLDHLDAEYGPMPILELVGLAQRAGVKTSDGVSDGQDMLVIRPLNADAAATTTEIIARRFEEMDSLRANRPYTELFRIADVAVSDDGAGMLTLDPLANLSLADLFYSGDLRFLNFG